MMQCIPYKPYRQQNSEGFGHGRLGEELQEDERGQMDYVFFSVGKLVRRYARRSDIERLITEFGKKA